MKTKTFATAFLVSLLIGVNSAQAATPADLVDCNNSSSQTSVKEEYVFSYQKILIQPGDTLTKLSIEYQISVETLLDLNPHIDNPNLIYAGETLKIRQHFAPEPYEPSELRCISPLPKY